MSSQSVSTSTNIVLEEYNSGSHFASLRELCNLYGEDRIQATCPYCGNTFSYSERELQGGGLVSCRGCGSIIETRRKPSFQGTGPAGTDPVFSSQPQTYQKQGVSGASIACAIIFVLLFIPLYIALPLAACIGLWYMGQNKK